MSRRAAENEILNGVDMETGEIIDFDRLAASIGGRPLILSPTEYKILKIFTGNPLQKSF